jgi:thiosulfate dehydrogenase
MPSFLTLAYGLVLLAAAVVAVDHAPQQQSPPVRADAPPQAAAAETATASGAAFVATPSWPGMGQDGAALKAPPGPWGDLVAYGRDLTVRTYALIGPEVADPKMRHAGNNLSCQNCHLEAGTKKFALPFVGVFGDFPQYLARMGEVGTIEDRINGCMTRSMNGTSLALDSREMKAFVAWIRFLSTGVPIGAPTEGRGTVKPQLLQRAADPARGAALYRDNCAACHMPDGQGKRRGKPGDAQGYEFPPLWGNDTYNDGAGMAHLIEAAGFIRSNMPNGTSSDSPVLSLEDAWDIAAYVASQPRPAKGGLDRDFPNRAEKPADAAYAPFPDGFPAPQHKYGPFQPLLDARKAEGAGAALRN